MNDNNFGAAEGSSRESETVSWYRGYAEAGYADAQYNLANCYFNGWGVSRNLEEAVKWYRRSAEGGNAEGQYYLCYCYFNGYGVPQDYAEAVKWLKMSAEQGNSEAEYMLGYCYSNGYGVPRDYAEAERWLKRSAIHGNGNAEGMLKTLPSGAAVESDEPEGSSGSEVYSEVKLGDRTLNQLYSLGVIGFDAARKKEIVDLSFPYAYTAEDGAGCVIAKIGPGAFSFCGSLESVEIPYGVKEIDMAAFSACGSLKRVVIPDSVTRIGSLAFSLCYSLEELDVPASVTSIGKNAFLGVQNVRVTLSSLDAESRGGYPWGGVKVNG